MKTTNAPDCTVLKSEQDGQKFNRSGKALDRSSFLKKGVVAGAAVTAGAALLENIPSALAEEGHGHLTRGDVAIQRDARAGMWQIDGPDVMKRHSGKKVVNPQWQSFELSDRDPRHRASFAASPDTFLQDALGRLLTSA